MNDDAAHLGSLKTNSFVSAGFHDHGFAVAVDDGDVGEFCIGEIGTNQITFEEATVHEGTSLEARPDKTALSEVDILNRQFFQLHLLDIAVRELDMTAAEQVFDFGKMEFSDHDIGLRYKFDDCAHVYLSSGMWGSAEGPQLTYLQGPYLNLKS
jgi:hypothetical protein